MTLTTQSLGAPVLHGQLRTPVLRHVVNVQFYPTKGEDLSAVAVYQPLDGGNYDGQVGIPPAS